MYLLLDSTTLIFLFLVVDPANFQKDGSLQSDSQQINLFPEPPKCGVLNESKLSHLSNFHGTVAKRGGTPWMVGFFPLKCGGSLLNFHWVLSASHCFYNTPYSNSMAYLGTVGCKKVYDENQVLVERCCDSTAEAFRIKKVFLHEEYDNETLVNDIALVQLDGSVTFSNEIQPICLPINFASDVNIFGSDAFVGSWFHTENNSLSEYLVKAKVKIDKFEECQDPTNSYVCAGAENDENLCDGDAGGPLYMQLDSSKDVDTQHYYQVGIVAHDVGLTEKCGEKNALAKYTNVLHYITWIKKHMKIFDESRNS